MVALEGAPPGGVDLLAGAVRAGVGRAGHRRRAPEWDEGTFRIFYLLGAILTVPWLALGTIYLLFGKPIGNRVRTVLLVFTGLAVGVMLAAPIHGTIAPDGGIPVGKDHFGVLPRALAGAASGIGAIVVFAGAVWSAVRFAREARVGIARRRERARSRWACSCCRAAGCCRASSVRTRASSSRSRPGSR